MYFYYGYDYSYLLLIIVSTVLGIATQAYINHTYKQWSDVPTSTGETGAQVARRMLVDEGASQVGITSVAGRLTDYYDPRDDRLHLSQDNLNGGTVASVAVACHEAGHAVQHAQGYAPLRFRNALVPVVNFASQAWMVVFFLGVFANLAGFVTLAIILFAFSVIFQLVTLPVEINASHRAVKYIESCGLTPEAAEGARSVLTAAALTYVAAALTSILQLLWLMGRSRD
jgi:Zn-dependent membrane protease YugP